VLHFSGHGGRDENGAEYIVLETPDGAAQMLTVQQLSSILGHRRGAAVDVVFVSACNSVEVGNLFIGCGARYVVAVARGSKVMDRSSLLFARAFYHALFTGHSTSTAFQIARSRVDVEVGRGEAVKFVLLAPAHTVVSSSLLGPPPPTEVIPFPPGSTPSGPFIDRSEHPPSYMWLPSPPDVLVGRRREMYSVVAQLTAPPPKGSRLVTLRGFPGIGKTTVAVAVAHFIMQRTSSMEALRGGVVVVALRGVDSAAAVVDRVARSLAAARRHAARHGGTALHSSGPAAVGAGCSAAEDEEVGSILPAAPPSPKAHHVPPDAPAAFHLPSWGEVLSYLGSSHCSDSATTAGAAVTGSSPHDEDSSPHVLLVLDNLEDALNADAAGIRLLLGSLLWAAPGVRVLATSRRPVVGDGVLSTIAGDVSHTRESVISLSALPASEAAELLVRRSPRRLTRVEVFGEQGLSGGVPSESDTAAMPADVGSSRPDGKTAALGRLAGHPVLRYLNGHPHAITLAAALLLDRSLSEVAHFLKTKGAISLTPAGMPHLLGGLSPHGTPLPTAGPDSGSLTPSAMQSSLSLAGSLSASVTALAAQHGETLPLLLLCGLLPRGMHDGDFVWLCSGLPFMEGLVRRESGGGMSPYMPRGSPPLSTGRGGGRTSPAHANAPSSLDMGDSLSICSGSTALSGASLGSRASSVESTGSAMTAFSALMGGGRSSPVATGSSLFGTVEAAPGPPLMSRSASDGASRPRALAHGGGIQGSTAGGMPWWAQDGLNPWGGAALADKLRRRRSKLVSRATGKKGPRGGVQGGWSGMRNLRFEVAEAGGIATGRPRANAAGRGVHVLTAVTESMFEGGAGGLEGINSPHRPGVSPSSGSDADAAAVDWRAAADILVQWSILERRPAGGGGIPQARRGGDHNPNSPNRGATSPSDDDVPLALAVLHAWLSLVYLGEGALSNTRGDTAPGGTDSGASTAVPSGAVSVGSAHWDRASVASGHSLSALSFGGGSSLLTFDTVGDDLQGGAGGGSKSSLPPMDAASILAWALSPSSVCPPGVAQGPASIPGRLRAAARLSLRWYSTYPYVVEYARYTLAPPLSNLLPQEQGGADPAAAVPRSSIVPPFTRMMGGTGGGSSQQQQADGTNTPLRLHGVRVSSNDVDTSGVFATPEQACTPPPGAGSPAVEPPGLPSNTPQQSAFSPAGSSVYSGSPAREAFEAPLSLSREDSRDSAGGGPAVGAAGRGGVLGMGKGRGRPEGPGGSRIPRPRKAGVQGVGAIRNGMGAGKGGQGISAYVPRPPTVGGSSLARPRPMGTPPREAHAVLHKRVTEGDAKMAPITVPMTTPTGMPGGIAQGPPVPASPPTAHRRAHLTTDGTQSPRGTSHRPPSAAGSASSGGGRSRRSTGGGSVGGAVPLSSPTAADKDPRPPPSMYGAAASVAKAATRCALTPAVLPGGLDKLQGMRSALLLRLALHLRCVGQFAFACGDAMTVGAASQAALVCTGLYAASARELLQLAKRELLLVCAVDEGGRQGSKVSLDGDGGPLLEVGGYLYRDPDTADGSRASDSDGDSDGGPMPGRDMHHGGVSHASNPPAPLRMPIRSTLLPSSFVLAARTGVKQAVLAGVYFSQALLVARQLEAAVAMARGALRLCGESDTPGQGAAPGKSSTDEGPPGGSVAYGIRFRFGAACAHKALGIALACSGGGVSGLGALESAKGHLAAARGQFRACGCRHGEALAWAAQGHVLGRLQNVHGAQRCFQEALLLAEGTGLLEAQLLLSSQLAALAGKAGDRESSSHLHAASRRLRGRLHEERVRLSGSSSSGQREHLLAAVLSHAADRFASSQQAAADALASTASRRGELPVGLVSRMQYGTGGGGSSAGQGRGLHDIPFDFVPGNSEVCAYVPRSGLPDVLAMALEVPVQPPSLRGYGASKRVAVAN